MKNPYYSIIALLKENKVEYEEIAHEPVFTSEQAAKVRGLSIKQGAKSLLLKVGDKFVLVVLPGDKRLDSKKVKDFFKVKDLRFATKEEVVSVTGCEVGACYPFGNISGRETYVDKDLSKNKVIAFNPGRHGCSIKIAWRDYFRIVKPSLVDFSA